MSDRDTPLPIGEHLKELRRRALISVAALIVCSSAFAIISPTALSYLARPLMDAMPAGSTFVVLTPFEAWFAYFRISLIGGAILSAPIWCAELFSFMSPAVDSEIRRLAAICGIVAGLLFIIGAAFCYHWVLPAGFAWALEMTEEMGATMMPRLESYISFTVGIVAAFGLAFELPFAVAMLIRLGVVSASRFSSARKYAIVGAFVLGAVLAPPDVLSQIALAIPLILLYEVGIVIGRVMRGRAMNRRCHDESQ